MILSAFEEYKNTIRTEILVDYHRIATNAFLESYIQDFIAVFDLNLKD